MQINWHDIKLLTVAIGVTSSFLIPIMFWYGYNVGFQEGLKQAFKMLGI